MSQPLWNLQQCYKILNVSAACTYDEARNAYRNLSKKYHPDNNKHPRSASIFKSVYYAWQKISSEDFDKQGNRKTYDFHPIAYLWFRADQLQLDLGEYLSLMGMPPLLDLYAKAEQGFFKSEYDLRTYIDQYRETKKEQAFKKESMELHRSLGL